MSDRVEVFVDTSYLLASFYNSWTTGARAQLEIDLPAVTEHLNDIVSKKLELPVFRQFWYDGIPDSGPHRYQRTLRHIDGVQLRAGQLIEWGDRRTQKGVDTRLVADMVLHAVLGHVQEIVLVSGDADMIPGVQVALEHGARVHLIGFGWDSMSNSLRSTCDTVTVLDPRDDFEECMHIEVLDSFNLLNNKKEGDTGETPTKVTNDDVSSGTADTVGTTVTNSTEDDNGAPDINHSVPLIPPVLSPGKVGRSGVPSRNHTHSAVVKKGEAGSSANTKADAKIGTKDSDKAIRNDDAFTAPVEDTKARSDIEAAQVVVGSDTVSALPDAEFHRPHMCNHEAEHKPPRRPSPSMMAQKRQPLQRSRYIPLPYDEVWESAGNQTPYDIGQQYAIWWYNNVATPEQRSNAHTLTGGGLPTEVDRPLLQFACQILDAYTLNDFQRVNLRDGFHMGIRGILMKY